AAVLPLTDPGIVACQGLAGDGAAGAYLVCEAQSGMSLARALEALAVVGARFASEAILRVARAALAALAQAARPLPGTPAAPGCHGLLTPENIFLAEGQRVLVRGFGLWPQVREAGLVRPAEARYLAAAQLESRLASPRSDLFS